MMSASELEQAEPVHSERRMSITSSACDIMSASEPEQEESPFRANGECRSQAMPVI